MMLKRFCACARWASVSDVSGPVGTLVVAHFPSIAHRMPVGTLVVARPPSHWELHYAEGKWYA